MDKTKKISLLCISLLTVVISLVAVFPKNVSAQTTNYVRGDITKCVDGTTIIGQEPDAPPVDLNEWNNGFCASHRGYDPVGINRCDNGEPFAVSPDFPIDPKEHCQQIGSSYSYVRPPNNTGGSGGAVCDASAAGGGGNCISYNDPEKSFACSVAAGKTSGECFKEYLNIILRIGGAVVGMVITIMLIVGGIRYASSAGDPNNVAAAKKIIFNAILGLVVFIFMGAFLNTVSPGGVFGTSADKQVACTRKADFFGLPPWYKYLDTKWVVTDASTGEGVCKIVTNGDLVSYVVIGLAIIDILLRLTGLVAVAYVIYGGIKYVISQGEPENAKTARRTITSALIGLAIAIVASNLVAFIAKQLAK